jgi:hypothetical protein
MSDVDAMVCFSADAAVMRAEALPQGGHAGAIAFSRKGELSQRRLHPTLR